jgi:YVTN family beta-propeller protein
MRIDHRVSILLLGSSVAGAACDSKASPPSSGDPATPTLGAVQRASQREGIDPRPLVEGTLLPTGARITPEAVPGARFQTLNPDLSALPDFVADHAVTTASSPDGKLLLVLTSGYNATTTPDDTGNFVPELSNEYVFVYDISVTPPVKRQVLMIPNSFVGMAWHPSGDAFYVSGGVDDNLHVFQRSGASSRTMFAEVTPAIALGHSAGLGLAVPATAAGVGVDGDGRHAVVANYENDSVSIVNLVTRAVSEVELRPGKIDGAQSGKAGGAYPYWIEVKGQGKRAKAYVSSQRDREVVVVDVATATVHGRITVGAQPNKMLLSHDGAKLYVANGGADTISVVDTRRDRVVEEFQVTAPETVLRNPRGFKGANPNSLALAPDGQTLFVTNGGINAIAVVQLAQGNDRGRDQDDDGGDANRSSRVVGLIPTGWYPESVTLSGDGRRFFAVNGKGLAGAGCLDVASNTRYDSCWNGNAYVWQLEKAGLVSAPVPGGATLGRLTRQVAVNNHFPNEETASEHRHLMAFLRSRIKHVVYVVKENRTYDQVLGDLPRGNGDPLLTLFPEANTPNHHGLANQFVTLDAFQDTGETSGVGWNWTMSARTTDSVEKTQPVNYAGRGLNYDWEGTNRNINVGLATLADRLLLDPVTPADPDLLPGTADVASGDPADGEAASASYLWDAALRKGLAIRNYGCFGDLTRSSVPAASPIFIPLERHPFAAGTRQFYPAKAALQTTSDLYFRGYDNKYPDFWRFKEWEREFDQFAANGNLPALELVRFPHDHFGSFSAAIDDVNTPERQMADNDYAVGQLVEKIAHSRYRDDTLIFVVEDDAQDGPDHVSAHRSIALVLGPYVKQGSVVSTPYNTVSMVKTIEEVLGLEPLGLNDALAAPMADVFDESLPPWAFTYVAKVPEILRSTALPVPAATAMNTLAHSPSMAMTGRRGHGAAYWEHVMRGQNFDREDALDTPRFNHALWRGIMGNRAYPTRAGDMVTAND